MSAESGRPGPTQRACPICGKQSAERYRPFCSKRCADIDLGRWLDGRYRVPGPPASPEDIESEAQEEEGDEATLDSRRRRR